MIIFLSPLFDHNLCLVSVGENPAVETIAAKRPVEALDERVLPRTAQFDIRRFALLIPQPLLKCISHEFGTIVAAQVVRRDAPG